MKQTLTALMFMSLLTVGCGSNSNTPCGSKSAGDSCTTTDGARAGLCVFDMAALVCKTKCLGPFDTSICGLGGGCFIVPSINNFVCLGVGSSQLTTGTNCDEDNACTPTNMCVGLSNIGGGYRLCYQACDQDHPCDGVGVSCQAAGSYNFTACLPLTP